MNLHSISFRVLISFRSISPLPSELRFSLSHGNEWTRFDEHSLRFTEGEREGALCRIAAKATLSVNQEFSIAIFSDPFSRIFLRFGLQDISRNDLHSRLYNFVGKQLRLQFLVNFISIRISENIIIVNSSFRFDVYLALRTVKGSRCIRSNLSFFAAAKMCKVDKDRQRPAFTAFFLYGEYRRN